MMTSTMLGNFPFSATMILSGDTPATAALLNSSSLPAVVDASFWISRRSRARRAVSPGGHPLKILLWRTAGKRQTLFWCAVVITNLIGEPISRAPFALVISAAVGFPSGKRPRNSVNGRTKLIFSHQPHATKFVGDPPDRHEYLSSPNEQNAKS